ITFTMATELEILQSIREDIRKWLGITSNTQLVDTLNSINNTLQTLLRTNQILLDILAGKPINLVTSTTAGSPLLTYFTMDSSSPIIINPNTPYPLINAQGTGEIYYVWVVISGHNNFTLKLLIDDADFGITPDELITYSTSALYIQNDWNWTFLNTSSTPPVFGIRWQGNLPIRKSLHFSVVNNDMNNPLTITQYRYAYAMTL
ncbi:MAG: hypothetical protein ACPLVI_06855, partial [Thermoplasmata archaeon]